jgi:protein-L-isoaspartate(D-aspartate) O-methyltransferase
MHMDDCHMVMQEKGLMTERRLLAMCLCLSLVPVACAVQPSLPRSMAPTITHPTPASSAVAPDSYAAARQRMVETQMMTRDITDPEVLAAMQKVPRHLFVPPEDVDRAYGDHPLPIGYGQTISQPYMVAAMSQLLDVKPGDKILEIGTGSGYQAAVLAELTDQVYTVEIIEELAESAAARLRELGYTQVHIKNADGYFGWEEYAPYDAIIVTAAPDHIPQPLVKQLKEGGRLVIPVGPQGSLQTLWLVEKKGDQVLSRQVMGVVFVPLTGKH